jgi:hypothetical protein
MGGLVSQAIGTVANTAGGLISGSKGAQAANQQATAFRDAATWARNQAAFQPFGITNTFGTSNFGIDPTTGRVTSAGYSLSPQLSNIQAGLMGAAANYDPTQYLAGSNAMLNLGNQYLAQSPEAAAQDYYNQQQRVLAGPREQELAQARNAVYQTGRSGLATGGTTTGMMQSNPELAALYNARAQQDLNLLSQADKYGMERTRFGAGLLSSAPSVYSGAYSPLQTQLGLASTVEKLGMSPYEMSIGLGKTIADAGATQGRFYMAGEEMAAKPSMAYASYSPTGQFLQGTGQSLMGMSGGGGTANWFDNFLTRQSNQADPNFVGPRY